MSQYHDEVCHYLNQAREERDTAHFNDLVREVSDRYYVVNAEKMTLQSEVARLKRENEALRGTLNEIADVFGMLHFDWTTHLAPSSLVERVRSYYNIVVASRGGVQ